MPSTYKNKFNAKFNLPLQTNHSIKEISELTGYQVNGLKTIYNKGLGAYHSNPNSVRPQVHSAEQWAMARVYAAINPLSKASKVDEKHLIKKRNKL